MIQFKKLDHIQVCTPTGKEEARQFCTGIIRLKEIPKPAALMANGGLWYEVTDIQFHIGTGNEVNNSKRHPAFEVPDIGEARNLLVLHSVVIKEEIQIPGQKRFSFFDPFSKQIELLQKV